MKRKTEVGAQWRTAGSKHKAEKHFALAHSARAAAAAPLAVEPHGLSLAVAPHAPLIPCPGTQCPPLFPESCPLQPATPYHLTKVN